MASIIKTTIDNAFSRFFRQHQNTEEDQREREAIVNSQTNDCNNMDSFTYTGDPYYDVYGDKNISYVDFQPILTNKTTRLGKYREMSLYPEINEALDVIKNDAIVPDEDGVIAKLKIDPTVKMPKNVEIRVREAYKYIYNKILNFDKNGENLFYKWLLEAELFQEIILDKQGKHIIAIKPIACRTMLPVYKNNRIVGFVQYKNNISYTGGGDKDQVKTFERNQIVYTNYEEYGRNKSEVKGYLEYAIRVYNQLKALEDAIVVYRLVRAPERRVWNVFTGRMSKGKSEEYMKGLINRFKRKNVYDTSTGSIDSKKNVQAMSEDIWFSKDENGNGTSVDNIGGGMQLGELGDIDYFYKKLYKALKMPKSRWEDSSSAYSSGKIGEIERDEVKFARFIESQQRKFKPVLKDPFMLELQLRGIDEKYLDPRIYDIEFTKSNLFKIYKELELYDARLGLLSTAASYIATAENQFNPEALFSQEYVMRKIFNMDEVEYKLNKKLLEKEISEEMKAREEMGFGVDEEPAKDKNKEQKTDDNYDDDSDDKPKENPNKEQPDNISDEPKKDK
jgi:hypothetical protein